MSELVVYFDRQLCGRIEQSRSGNITFRYEREYREADDPTPLSLSMPLAASIDKKRAILPYLQGLLPDSDEALRAMARRFAVSANSPFALLEQVSSDVAGAVQIVKSDDQASGGINTRSKVRPVSSGEVGTMLEHVVTERYDRALVDGRWRQLHQEDFCQALSVSPNKKYQHRDGGPGLANIARLIRSLPFESDRRAVGERFYRGLRGRPSGPPRPERRRARCR